MSIPPPVSPMLAIQGAIRALLVADSELQSLGVAVYDYLPETVPYPFIVIGEATEVPANAHDRFGWETVPTLHVWDKRQGFKRVLQIGGRLTALLDHQPLRVPGYDHIVTRFEVAQPLTDPEPPGDIRHLVHRYRVLTAQPR
ncbi:DUF3168 domain-containing protein [Streptomyces nymphaeiformis]|jgi:hypothetical protein|uniref:DUF3168 domain-containing protein n=1 Tax=Streptomyces nymphaeiformis TaxID=2663842 RepID=A0A7W7U9P1_9ACTN|nr:DUF3168 domain-containing protein [Streptomyces nymphaeiformis]MBB4987494.1 hypothetical protein [Streptomyces nymphaeiformis]